MTACPAQTSKLPSLCVTRTRPRNTMVYSSNSGVWPGSSQPAGLRIWATLIPGCRVFRWPTYSSMILGRFPAACTRAGRSIRMGKSVRLLYLFRPALSAESGRIKRLVSSRHFEQGGILGAFFDVGHVHGSAVSLLKPDRKMKFLIRPHRALTGIFVVGDFPFVATAAVHRFCAYLLASPVRISRTGVSASPHASQTPQTG